MSEEAARQERVKELEREVQYLRQSLELARMSVAIIMARPGCSLDLDQEAKAHALRHIEEGLSKSDHFFEW